jgi:hypothetical protein
MPDIIRYPPDDGLVEAEIASFGGFWHANFSTRGSYAPTRDIDALRAGQCRIGCEQDATRPWFVIEHNTTERLTPALDRVAIAVPRLAARYRQRVRGMAASDIRKAA